MSQSTAEDEQHCTGLKRKAALPGPPAHILADLNHSASLLSMHAPAYVLSFPAASGSRLCMRHRLRKVWQIVAVAVHLISVCFERFGTSSIRNNHLSSVIPHSKPRQKTPKARTQRAGHERRQESAGFRVSSCHPCHFNAFFPSTPFRSSSARGACGA